MKQWGVLKQVYRSKKVWTHGKRFRLVAIVTQLLIENGQPLFQVEYVDPHVDDLNYFEHNGDHEEPYYHNEAEVNGIDFHDL